MLNFLKYGITVIVFLFWSVLIFSSCKADVVDATYLCNKAYCKWPDGTMKVINLSKWGYYASGKVVKLIAKDGSIYLMHVSNVILSNE